MDVTKMDVQAAVKTCANWKAAGIDKVKNFWIKYLHSTHTFLAEQYTKLLKDTPQNQDAECLVPKWLTQGVTHLLPKHALTENPKNYRPVACLPTMYKVLTKILAHRAYSHLENYLPPEQKGCKKHCFGCKDILCLNELLLKNCRDRKCNLSMSWIDYQKAFDSVPHSWLLRAMKLYKLHPVVIDFVKTTMPNWSTQIHLKHEGGTLITSNINIDCGIFQGDSFSPLLFTLALAPLSELPRKSGCGYDLGRKAGSQGNLIHHLFYMDDLKLFAKSDKQMAQMLDIVYQFSQDINMKFGLDKCAKVTIHQGEIKQSGNIQIVRDTAMTELEADGCYRYLVLTENNQINHKEMKTKLKKEYFKRVRRVLQSELN